MRPGEALAAGEAIHIDAHAGVELGIIGGRDSGCVVQQHGYFVVFGDGQFFLQFVAQIGGVNHCGVFAEGIGQFLGRVHQNQFGPGQADGAVERATAADHHHFMFQPGGVRKLPDFLVIGARHASCGGCGHSAGRTGGDDSRFRARQF